MRRIVAAGLLAGLLISPKLWLSSRIGSIAKIGLDHDPLYRFHQWEANLRILGLTEIKSVPPFASFGFVISGPETLFL